MAPRAISRLDRAGLIEAALGLRPATAVIRGARIVSVFTREIRQGDIAIWNGRIAAIGTLQPGCIGPDTEVIEARGRYALPGFIEPHFHCGDSALSMPVLAAALLQRGTTSLGTDMCEYYGIGGLPAVRWCIDGLQSAGLRCLFLLPLHSMGAEAFGTFRHTPDTADYLTMADWPEAIAVNEPPPHVILNRDPRVLQVLDACLGRGMRFEGHGPDLAGTPLQAYLAAGASSDHESLTAAEALEKLRLGARVMMRDCAASPDLDRIAALAVERPDLTRFMMVCSDDMQARELLRDGHIDAKLRKLMQAGVDPITAVQMATINVAEYLGVADDIGSIAPGKSADILLVDDLRTLAAPDVFAAGRLVAQAGHYLPALPAVTPPDCLIARVETGSPIAPADLRIAAPPGATSATVRVMGIEDGTLVSRADTAILPVIDGAVQPDPGRDILKIAVFDRHSGRKAGSCGFVSGFGLTSGAIATTSFWQHFSLLAVGTSDAEIAAAFARLARQGGGLVAVRDGETLASVPFPIGGIAAPGPIEEIARAIESFETACAALGCPLSSPTLSLAFASIPHIPSCGITDKGWHDTASGGFVEVVLRESNPSPLA